MSHEHQWTETDRHENDDRIRTRDDCPCGAQRYGCYAKRLDTDGEESWGPVGRWCRYAKEPGRRLACVCRQCAPANTEELTVGGHKRDVCEVCGHPFIGLEQALLLGIASLFYSFSIAVIPFLSSRIVRGEVFGTIANVIVGKIPLIPRRSH